MFRHAVVVEPGSWYRVDTASGSSTPTSVLQPDGVTTVPNAYGLTGSTVRNETPQNQALFLSTIQTLYLKRLTYQGALSGDTPVTSVGQDATPSPDPLPGGSQAGTWIPLSAPGKYAVVPAPTGAASTDTAAIHAARDTAGAGGRLIFSAVGTYRVNGLTANVAGQDWEIQSGVIVKLADTGTTHALTVDASNVTIRGSGTIDGNRGVLGTSQTYAGIHGTINANDLLVKDLTVQNTVWWGVWCEGTRSKVRRCRFTGTATTAVLMSSYSFSPTQQDTYDMEVADCFIDRTTENPATIANACIQVRGDISTSGKVTRRGRVVNNTILMVSNPTESTGLNTGIEFGAGSYNGIAIGNTVVGGGLGVSFAKADSGIAQGNQCLGQNLYSIEISDSPNCAITGNYIDVGTLPANGSAIATTGTGLSQDVAVTGNTISGTTNGGSGIGITGVRAAVTGNVVKCTNGIVFASASGTITGNKLNGEGLLGSRGIYLTDSLYVAVAGNNIRSFANGVELRPTTGAMDYISIANNVFRQCTTTVNANPAGGTIGNNVTHVGSVVAP